MIKPSKDISLNSTLLNLSSFGLVKNDALESELRQKGIETFDFTIGDPQEPTPDFIQRALIDHLTQVSQYPLSGGMFELRAAAAGWLKRRFDVSVNPKTQLLSSNGSKEAIFHVPQILIDRVALASQRHIIVFSEPAYPVYKSGTILAGGEACEIPLKESNQFVFNIDDIPKEKIPHIAALWICYPHNPTGALITEKQATKIYNWALENGIVLLSDECYGDMYFHETNRPLSFLQIAKQKNYKNLLCFFSLSKRSGMTGYRSGFIAGDEKLMALFAKYRLNVGVGTPDFVQHAAIAAWNDDAHVKIRNQIFFEKRQIIEAFLTKNHIEFLHSDATFYIWGTIPKKFDCAREFCEFLARHTGIFATPGEVFGPSSKKYFRLALVPTVSELKKCLSVWQASIDAGHFL